VGHESSEILLAEDNSAIQVLLHEVFEDEGYTVTCCSSAAEAIETLQQHTPALVISDMHMEHIGAGLQLLRQLRQQARTASTPAIVYSADSLLLRTLKPQIEALNAVAVEKPFNIDGLVMLARSLIRLQEREAP